MNREKQPSRVSLLPEPGRSVKDHIAYYHHMQKTQPIRYRPEYNLWEVFRYKDVQQVLSDYANFSAPKVLAETIPSALTRSDPPYHHQLRSLVSKTFTPHSIAERRLRLIKTIDELLEPAKASKK